MEFLSQIILAKVPIEDVVRRYSSDYNANTALCRCINPHHSDSTPSMKVYKETNSVYCFGCGFSGNVISVVSKIEGISLMQAMQRIRDWFDIKEDLSDLTLKERSNFARIKTEFDRTFDFYSKQWIKQGIRLPNEILSQLEDIVLVQDIKQLKDLYADIKAGKYQLL